MKIPYAQLCFGMQFPEGFSFPWKDDFKMWWRVENGLKLPKEYLDSKGNVKKRMSYAMSCLCSDWIFQFDRDNPCPVKLVKYARDCYIIADPKTYVHSEDVVISHVELGYLLDRVPDAIAKINKFVEKYIKFPQFCKPTKTTIKSQKELYIEWLLAVGFEK